MSIESLVGSLSDGLGWLSRGFQGNFVAGLISSVFTLIGAHVLNQIRLSNKFKPLAGSYAHKPIHESTNFPTDGVTELIYEGGNTFKTSGSSSEGNWTGRLTMRKDIPNLGDGVYRYIDENRIDCGIHQIQVSPDRKSINVLVVNTSYGTKYEGRTSAYLWVRE